MDESPELRLCQRPGCEEKFQPHAVNQRYCSLRCKQWVSNHSPAHLAAKQRHDERRGESGLKAKQDARWYHSGGWYKQYRVRLRARIAEHELRRQDARLHLDAAFETLDATIASVTDSAHNDDARTSFPRDAAASHPTPVERTQTGFPRDVSVAQTATSTPTTKPSLPLLSWK